MGDEAEKSVLDILLSGEGSIAVAFIEENGVGRIASWASSSGSELSRGEGCDCSITGRGGKVNRTGACVRTSVRQKMNGVTEKIEG